MPNIVAGNLQFRHSEPGDIPAIRQICNEVWGGKDYVPDAWPRYLAEDFTQPFILESEGVPAGLYCLRTGLAGPTSGWLQSVRVAPTFKRRGLGSLILEHAIATARWQDLQVLRFVTASDNAAMHHLAARFGFRFIADFLNCRYDPARLAPNNVSQTCRYVTTGEFDEAYNLAVNSEEYRRAEGFYANQWWWKPLNIDRLRQHLEKKEVYSLKGTLRAMAIMTCDEEGGRWLSLVTGKPADQQNLLAALARKIAAATLPGDPIELNGLFIQAEATECIIQSAGFVPDVHEPRMSLYELSLK